jgi:DNA-directed RNA polymerase specialized sigma24 family protein
MGYFQDRAVMTARGFLPESADTMTSSLLPDDRRSTGAGGFPKTRHSALRALKSDDRSDRSRAHGVVFAAYWKPVYKYVRLKWRRSRSDAEDLTQGFFAAAVEKEFFAAYDPDRARFRTFLRTCLDRFITNADKAATRLKRGGGVTDLSLDFQAAETELALTAGSAQPSVDDYFDREWTRSLLDMSVARLHAELTAAGKEVHFEIFRRYDIERAAGAEGVSYGSLAEALDLPVTTVTNYLAAARRAFRRIVLEHIRSLTATDDEYRDEVRAVLGVEPE